MTNMPHSPDISQLPHRRMEAWKWTDVQRAVPENLSGLTSSMSPRFVPPQHVSISQGEGQSSDHPMGQFAQNFAGQSWNIYLPENTKPKEPLLIEGLDCGHGRITIMLDAESELTLVEYHNSHKAGFANVDMQIHLKHGSKLTRIVVQDDLNDVTRIATACIRAEDDAQFDQYILSFGGALSRLETRLSGEGRNIMATMNGVYLLLGKRHADITSHTELKHPDCTIRQSVKGVVTDTAKGVFQGKFLVAREAQLTDAEMRHDALMLSEGAEVRAKPELEIYADDVACAHGNTIGALDESALFYMRQRGIPMAQAKALLTEAFIVSVFDDLDDVDMQASLMAHVKQWLEVSYGV